MEKFRIVQPSAVLTPYIRHFWLLECDDAPLTQRVIPTGHIELLFHRGCPMIRDGHMIPRTSVAGQSVSFSDLVCTGSVSMIAVVFHPFGAKAFFEMPVCELSGLVVSAEDAGLKALQELEDKILNTVDDDACIGLVEAFLTARLRPLREYNYDRMVAAIHAVNGCDGHMSVSRLAEAAYLGDKQFRRIFSEHVGMTPKEFMRIVRFHRALFTLQNNPSITFTRLAHACGFCDQAHMSGEFRLFSGYTPGEYVAVCAPYSDYFSN